MTKTAAVAKGFIEKWIDKAMKDDRTMCRMLFGLLVLHLLGILPDDILIGKKVEANTPPPKTIAFEWKESADGRACQPVFEDGKGWRLLCRNAVPPEGGP